MKRSWITDNGIVVAVLVCLLAYVSLGCSVSGTSANTEWGANQNLDGSGSVYAQGDVRVDWELPLVGVVTDLLVPPSDNDGSGE